MRGPKAGAVIAVLGAVAGCSQAVVLDAGRTQDSIRARLEDGYDVSVSEVSCPDDVELDAGGTFRCRVTTAGGRVDVVVEQVGDDGDLAVEPVQALVVTERVVDDIARVLGDRFDRNDADVTCPGPEVRVAEVGATFTCRAEDAGETRTIEVRVRDAHGALAYSLSEPEGDAG